MYKYQSTNTNKELLLPSGPERSIKSLLPDAPPLSLEEIVQQEYEVITRAILMQGSDVIKSSAKVSSPCKGDGLVDSSVL